MPTPSTHNPGARSPKHKSGYMIHFVSVILKEVFQKGRQYEWSRPGRCPRCHHDRLWGHGFVERLFDGFPVSLPIRRYRCNLCGCIITLRPDSHFPRIQAAKEEIRSALFHRIATGRWPTGLSPPRARHYLRNLRRNAMAYLSDLWKQGPAAAFDALMDRGRIPVRRPI